MKREFDFDILDGAAIEVYFVTNKQFVLMLCFICFSIVPSGLQFAGIMQKTNNLIMST